jgi:hypothetical protein
VPLLNGGDGMEVEQQTTQTFTISNSGVLSVIAGAGIEVDRATGDVTVTATGGGGGGLVPLYDNTPTGTQLPGGEQGILAFSMPDDGHYHVVTAGMLVHVVTGPLTCQIGWDAQGVLPMEAQLTLFDLVARPTDEWILSNIGGMLLPGNGGQMNVALSGGSGDGGFLLCQVWCTP